VFEHLSKVARRSGVYEAVVWRELLAGGQGHSVSGSALVPRTPDPSATRIGAAAASSRNTTELAAAAEGLRALLRLSICDDNDLRLARTVAAETRRFFTSLSVAAAERGVPPSELWRALELLGS